MMIAGLFIAMIYKNDQSKLLSPAGLVALLAAVLIVSIALARLVKRLSRSGKLAYAAFIVAIVGMLCIPVQGRAGSGKPAGSIFDLAISSALVLSDPTAYQVRTENGSDHGLRSLTPVFYLQPSFSSPKAKFIIQSSTSAYPVKPAIKVYPQTYTPYHSPYLESYSRVDTFRYIPPAHKIPKYTPRIFNHIPYTPPVYNPPVYRPPTINYTPSFNPQPRINAPVIHPFTTNLP
jgi:hypothetical protein